METHPWKAQNRHHLLGHPPPPRWTGRMPTVPNLQDFVDSKVNNMQKVRLKSDSFPRSLRKTILVPITGNHLPSFPCLNPLPATLKLYQITSHSRSSSWASQSDAKSLENLENCGKLSKPRLSRMASERNHGCRNPRSKQELCLEI